MNTPRILGSRRFKRFKNDRTERKWKKKLKQASILYWVLVNAEHPSLPVDINGPYFSRRKAGRSRYRYDFRTTQTWAGGPRYKNTPYSARSEGHEPKDTRVISEPIRRVPDILLPIFPKTENAQ